MTKKELKEQALMYIQDNLDLQTQLEVVLEILDNLSNCTYIDGFIYESNELTTCYLKIKEILKERGIK